MLLSAKSYDDWGEGYITIGSDEAIDDSVTGNTRKPRFTCDKSKCRPCTHYPLWPSDIPPDERENSAERFTNLENNGLNNVLNL